MSIAFFNIVFQSFKNSTVNPVSLLPARILDTPSQIRFNLKAALHSLSILPDFVHFSLFNIFVQNFSLAWLCVRCHTAFPAFRTSGFVRKVCNKNVFYVFVRKNVYHFAT